MPLEIFAGGCAKEVIMATVSVSSKKSVPAKGTAKPVSVSKKTVASPVEGKPVVPKPGVPSTAASKPTSKPATSPTTNPASKPASKPATAPVETPLPKVHMPSLQQLLEAGSHFGHKVSRWNPAMRQYIFDTRGGMHVIDLTKTIGMLEDAVYALSTVARKGNILLVGTKGQAATIIKNAGMDHGAYFISRRWPGGLLTNFKTVHRSVQRLMQLEEDLAAGRGYETKRERLVLERERERLAVMYEGIRFMDSVPVAMVVIDTKVEKNAIKEARKMGVPVWAIIDTNCDPRLVEYPIPGNDDAIKSIDLFMSVLVQAFSNTQTSAQLIGRRNDYHSRVDQIRRQTEAEEDRKRRETEYEVARLKAMKEGKTIEMPKSAQSSEGKVFRVVRQEGSSDTQRTVRVGVPKKVEKEVEKKEAKKAEVKVVAKKTLAKKPVAKKISKGAAKKASPAKKSSRTTSKTVRVKKKAGKTKKTEAAAKKK